MAELISKSGKNLRDYDLVDEYKALLEIEYLDKVVDTFTGPGFITKTEFLEDLFDASKYDNPEVLKISDIVATKPQSIKEVGVAPSDKVVILGWKNVENISARLIEIWDDQVVLECLIDKENAIYEERSFRKSLFEGYDIEIGNLFFIRFFERPHELKMEIHNDPGLTNIDDFPKMEFVKRFKGHKLFKESR